MTFIPQPDGVSQPAEEADRQIDQLLHTLYHEDGPTSTALLDYALGLVKAEEAQRIEQQLVTNAVARKELAELQALNQPASRADTAIRTPNISRTSDTQTSDADRVTAVNRFLQWVQQLWPQRVPLLALPQTPLVVAAVRGTENTYHVYAVGPYRLALTISPADEQPQTALCVVQGQLINQQQPDEACQGTVQIVPILRLAENHAFDARDLVATEAVLNEFGFFQLSLSSKGAYRLVVALPEHTIWIQELQIP